MDEKELEARLVKNQQQAEVLRKQVVKDLDKLAGLLKEIIKIKNILKIE